jgi:hypothetical protein
MDKAKGPGDAPSIATKEGTGVSKPRSPLTLTQALPLVCRGVEPSSPLLWSQAAPPCLEGVGGTIDLLAV